MNKLSVFQMKVTLQGIKPPIWRRFLVTSDTSFERLHEILQAVMGWSDYHLYEFQFAHERVAVADEEFDLFSEGQVHVPGETPIVGLFSREKKCAYMYDFGDGWEHVVQLEKVLEEEPASGCPVCVKGARMCPPEDCGGVWGYEELLAILKNPAHPEYEEKTEWLLEGAPDGEVFDPEAFDLERVNEALAAFRGARIAVLDGDAIDGDSVERVASAHGQGIPVDRLFAEDEPQPSREQWRRLYDMAAQIKQLAPWNELDSSDYIAVLPHGHKEPVFFITFGKLDEGEAVCAQNGLESMARLERMIERSENDVPVLAYGEQDGLICNFGDREDVNSRDKAVYKELGLKFRGHGEWIYFRSMRPGYEPWNLNADEADLLLRTMGAYIQAYCDWRDGKCKADFFRDEVLLCVATPPPSAEPWQYRTLDYGDCVKRETWVPFSDRKLVEKLRAAKKTNEDVEVDLLPVPLGRFLMKNKRMRLFGLAVIASRGAETFLDQRFSLEEGPPANALLNVLVSYVETYGRPRTVYVRDEECGSVLDDFCGQVGLKLMCTVNLPTIDEIICKLENDDGSE